MTRTLRPFLTLRRSSENRRFASAADTASSTGHLGSDSASYDLFAGAFELSHDVEKLVDWLQTIERLDDAIEIDSNVFVNDHVSETGEALEIGH